MLRKPKQLQPKTIRRAASLTIIGPPISSGAARLIDGTPTRYRLVQYPDGRQVLQGLYVWHKFEGPVEVDWGNEWKDEPTVILDEVK